MNSKAEEILREIVQLIAQYRAEVPGGRRAWPLAIKSRVLAAVGLGVRAKEIASRTELPYYTILTWIPKTERRTYRPRQPKESHQLVTGGHFSQLRVRPAAKAIATVTVAKTRKSKLQPPEHAGVSAPARRTHQSATVTVTLPSGIRIDGVTPEFLTSWLGQGTGAAR